MAAKKQSRRASSPAGPKAKRPKRVGAKGAPAASRPGRPTVLTPALSAAIVALIRAGNYMETAAAANGVDKSTLYAWLKKGARLSRENREEQEPPGIYSDIELLLMKFSNASMRARAEAESGIVGRIHAAGAKQWQACAWLAERMWPDRYGRRETIRLGRMNPEDIDDRSEIDAARMPTQDLEALEALLTKAMVRGEGDDEAT